MRAKEREHFVDAAPRIRVPASELTVETTIGVACGRSDVHDGRCRLFRSLGAVATAGAMSARPARPAPTSVESNEYEHRKSMCAVRVLTRIPNTVSS